MPSGDPLPPLPNRPACGLYRHYKGNLYEVLGIARHSESLEPMVLYRPLDVQPGIVAHPVFWVRPHAMWDELVEGTSGVMVPRFAPISS